jgi:ribosomal protein L20
MHALKTAGIALDRKILSDIAARDAGVFSEVVKAAA